jgi:hypothetical protein
VGDTGAKDFVATKWSQIVCDSQDKDGFKYVNTESPYPSMPLILADMGLGRSVQCVRAMQFCNPAIGRTGLPERYRLRITQAAATVSNLKLAILIMLLT